MDKDFEKSAGFINAAREACREPGEIYPFTCPLCGDKRAEAIRTRQGRLMAECPGCGMAVSM